MSPYESWLAKQELNEESVPHRICEQYPGILSDEEFLFQLRAMTLSSELRALRKALWILLKHRFQSVPRYWENQMVSAHDPERLLAAFKKALIVERIEDLRI